MFVVITHALITRAFSSKSALVCPLPHNKEGRDDA